MKSSNTNLDSLAVSVIVPVRNESRHIQETLDGLLSQEYPESLVEILVVDGESTDTTVQIVSEYADRDRRIRLLRNPCRLASGARNVGIRASNGDVVVVIDGHCQFKDNHYLENLSAAFSRSNADCLGRPQSLDVEGTTKLQRSIAAARASRLGHHPSSFVYSDKEISVPAHSVGVAYRRSVFDTVGYFDESFDACEDVEFNHRIDKAGLLCFLTPSIALRYHPRGSLFELSRQLARYGCGRIRLVRKHPETFSWLTVAPAAFLALLIVGAPISFLWHPFAYIYFGVVVAYLLVVMAFSLGISIKHKRWSMLMYLPVVFLCIHFGAGYGSLREATASLFRQSDGPRT